MQTTSQAVQDASCPFSVWASQILEQICQVKLFGSIQIPFLEATQGSTLHT